MNWNWTRFEKRLRNVGLKSAVGEKHGLVHATTPRLKLEYTTGPQVLQFSTHTHSELLILSSSGVVVYPGVLICAFGKSQSVLLLLL